MSVQTPSTPALSAARVRRWNWIEPLLAVLVFLLPLLSNLPFESTDGWVIVPIALLTFGVLIAGLAQGLPRWSMPVIGMLLLAPTFSGMAFLLQKLPPLPVAEWASSRALDAREAYALVVDGLFWLAYLVLTGLLVAAARLMRRALRAKPGKWPRLLQRLLLHRSRDWTMLSFLFYGANIAWLLVSLIDYDYAGPLVLIVVTVLVAGALLYLRAWQPRQRIVILVGANLLAGILLAAGKWVLIPMQAWGFWFKLHPPEAERWFAAVSTLHNSLYLSALLALPSFLLPGRKKGAGLGIEGWGLED